MWVIFDIASDKKLYKCPDVHVTGLWKAYEGDGPLTVQETSEATCEVDINVTADSNETLGFTYDVSTLDITMIDYSALTTHREKLSHLAELRYGDKIVAVDGVYGASRVFAKTRDVLTKKLTVLRTNHQASWRYLEGIIPDASAERPVFSSEEAVEKECNRRSDSIGYVADLSTVNEPKYAILKTGVSLYATGMRNGEEDHTIGRVKVKEAGPLYKLRVIGKDGKFEGIYVAAGIQDNVTCYRKMAGDTKKQSSVVSYGRPQSFAAMGNGI
jgi:hypothetical protein